MEWETGICGCCCEDFGLWACAFVCPCVIYAQNLAMMRRQAVTSYVPLCDDNAVVPGCIHGAALYFGYVSPCFITGSLGSFGGVPVLMQCITRGNIRGAYKIKGCCCHEFRASQTAVYQAQCDCWEDLFFASCCMSCSLVQERRQLQKEVPHLTLLYPEFRNTMRVQG